MDMQKRVLAVWGVAFRSLAMLYLVFASSLTLKNFGLSIENQFKENGITCDMGKLGDMHKGVKGAICADPLRNGREGTVPTGFQSQPQLNHNDWGADPCKMGVLWGLSPKFQ